MVLRKIFDPTEGRINKILQTMPNKKLFIIFIPCKYYSNDVIKEDETKRHVACLLRREMPAVFLCKNQKDRGIL